MWLSQGISMCFLMLHCSGTSKARIRRWEGGGAEGLMYRPAQGLQRTTRQIKSFIEGSRTCGREAVIAGASRQKEADTCDAGLRRSMQGLKRLELRRPCPHSRTADKASKRLGTKQHRLAHPARPGQPELPSSEGSIQWGLKSLGYIRRALAFRQFRYPGRFGPASRSPLATQV